MEYVLELTESELNDSHRICYIIGEGNFEQLLTISTVILLTIFEGVWIHPQLMKMT
jgi:hypothetical protein